MDYTLLELFIASCIAFTALTATDLILNAIKDTKQ